MKIAVVQYMYGNEQYFLYSQAINQYYCSLHGYEYVFFNEEPRQDRHVNWHKVEVMERFLHNCDSDYVLFLDADAHFYAMSLTIEKELVGKLNSHPDSKDILLAEDILCESVRSGPGIPNSGVVFMKANDLVRKFYQEWNTSSDICKQWRLKETYQGYQLADQAALRHYLYPKYQQHIFLTKEYYLMNAVYGQYIRHYAWMNNENRLARFKEYVKRYLVTLIGKLPS